MILTGGPGGGDLLSTLASAPITIYDPVYGAELDPSFFWKLLPDGYKVLSDQDQIELLWRGLMLLAARELQALYQVDASKSLATFPPEWQRKWIALDYIADVDFVSSPVFTRSSTKFVVNLEAQRLDGSWIAQGALDRSIVALRGAVDESFTLRWGFSFELDSIIPVGSLLFVGYTSRDSTDLASSLLVGVGLGDGENRGELALVHFPPTGPSTFVRSTAVIEPDRTYAVRVEYLGQDRTLTAVLYATTEGTITERVLELALPLVQGGPTGTFSVDSFGTANFDITTDERILTGTGSAVVESDPLVTRVFEDLGASFLTGGVSSGDVVRIDDHGSVELGVVGVVSETRIRVDTDISTAIVDSAYRLRSATHILDPDERAYSGSRYSPVSLLGFVSEWFYADPYLDARVRQIPRLTNQAVSPTRTLEANADYEVDSGGVKFGSPPVDVILGNGTAEGGGVYFSDPSVDFSGRGVRAGESILVVESRAYLVTEVLADSIVRVIPVIPPTTPSPVSYRLETPIRRFWGEYASFDDGILGSNFGHLVLLPEATATPEDLARVRGLFYSLFRGGTVENIRRGVHILLGLPIAVKGGTVTQVNPVYSGQKGLVVIRGADGKERSHTYPLILGTTVAVGDVVSEFEPLSPGVELVDQLSRPNWWRALGIIHELERFHTFAVEVDTRAFEDEFQVVRDVQSFIDRIAPSYKLHFITARKDLSDDQDRADDHLTFALDARFEDVAYGDVNRPYVGARRTPPQFDYSVGQGWTTADPGSNVYIPLSTIRPQLQVGRFELDHPDDPMRYIFTNTLGPTLASAPNTGSFPDDLDGDARTQLFVDPNATFIASGVGQYDILMVSGDPLQRYIIDTVISQTQLRVMAEVVIHAAQDLPWLIYLDSTATLVA